MRGWARGGSALAALAVFAAYAPPLGAAPAAGLGDGTGAALPWERPAQERGDTILTRADSLRARVLNRVRDLSEARPDTAAGDTVAGRAPADRAPGAAVPPPAGQPRQGAPPGAEVPPGADSVMRALMGLEGYTPATYGGLHALYVATDRTLLLTGSDSIPARFSGQGTNLEADSTIAYDDRTGRVRTQGWSLLTSDSREPVLSRTLIYDVREERGTALGAETAYTEGARWIVRGDLDSVEEGRLFGTRARFTSCELDPPHSYFQADDLKVLAGRVLIARSVRLYFDDVPVAWLPFIAQPLTSGRSSGLLTPRFSVNDVVRTSAGYQRRLSNVGYYWAMSDYSDATVAMDWWSGRYSAMTGSLRYRWARRFLGGDISTRRFWREGGGRDFALSTRNNWEATERTRVSVSGNYVTNTGFVRRNSLDPRELTASIDSDAGLQHRFDWGNLAISGNRRQFLTDDRVEMTLPNASLSVGTRTLFAASPAQASWYNNLSVNGSSTFRRQVRQFEPQPDTAFLVQRTDQVRTTGSARASASLGNLSLSGNMDVADNFFSDVPVDLVHPPPAPPGNGDEGASGLVSPAYRGVLSPLMQGDPLNGGPLAQGMRQGYRDASANWSLSLGYQQRLIGNSSLTPSVTMSGNFGRVDSIPEARTWVEGPTRFSLGVSAQTEIYGFFPGFGPFDAIRHKVTPNASWRYSPESTATALQQRVFGAGTLRVQNSVSLGFNQTFEARVSEPDEPDEDPADRGLPDPRPGEAPDPETEEEEPPPPLPGDEREEESPAALLGRPGRSGLDEGPRRLPQANTVTLLALNTSAVNYDIQRADSTGRFIDGFTSTQLNNTIRSDYLRGLDLSFTHDLFEDPVFGREGSRRLSPHLSQLSTGFSINDRSGLVRWIVGALGLESETPSEDPTEGRRVVDLPGEPADEDPDRDPFAPTDGFDSNRIIPGSAADPGQAARPRQEGWDANIRYSLRRPRDTGLGQALRAQMVSASLSFRPSENWDASWQTSYDVEERRFNDHALRLNRDLHEWEASFGFRQTVNGNWTFLFEVSLRANRDLRFDHELRNVDGAGSDFGGGPPF